MNKILKLITGEEIIANVVHESNTVTIQDPLLIITYDDGSSTFSPFMDLAEVPRFEINASHIIISAAPSEDMNARYNDLITAVYKAQEEKNKPQFILPTDKIFVPKK